jgi:membrane carboxypeptidase/penicillin-binding protein PbpC
VSKALDKSRNIPIVNFLLNAVAILSNKLVKAHEVE